MNILVTGGTGFIGKYIIDELRNDNCLYIISKTKSEKIKNLNFINLNLNCRNFKKKLPSNINYVIHLAQSRSYRDFPSGTIDMLQVNVDAIVELLEWSRLVGVEKFLLTSTANVYKNSETYLSEESQTIPSSFYGSTKLAAENFALQYQKYFQVDILRCFTVYGPNQKNMLLSNIIEKVLTGQEITLANNIGLYLSPIYVNDLVLIIKKLLCMDYDEEHRIINVCGNEKVSLYEITKIIEQYSGKKGLIKTINETPKCIIGSNAKLLKLFPDIELTNIKEGIKQTLSWIENNY